MPIKHPFHNPEADGTDATVTRPSDWNADHSIILTQPELTSILFGAIGTGSAGQFLETNGPSSLVAWGSAAGGGGGVSVFGTPLVNQLTGWNNAATILALSIGNNLSLINTTLSASGSGGGGVSVVGAPSAGNLTRWTSGATITNADLSGDVATSGSTITTIKSSVALAGAPTTNTAATGDNSTNIATTAFVTTAVNNAISGVNPAIAVSAATTQASDTSTWTYNNGASGVGATFTGPVNTAITIDGVTFTSTSQSLLVKNDTQSPSGAFNGIYNLTALQTALTGAIFTRRSDYNQPSDINNTGAIPVVNGTANGSTTWVLTSAVATVGTDPLTYTQFSLKPSTIPVISGTPSAGLLAGWANGSSILGVTIGSNVSLIGGNTLSAIGSGGGISVVPTPTAGQLTAWGSAASVLGVTIGSNISLVGGNTISATGSAGALTLVSSQSPSSAATVVFSGFQTGKDLIVVARGRSDLAASLNDRCCLRFNGDNSASYAFERVEGAGTAVTGALTAFSIPSLIALQIPAATGFANFPGAVEWSIFDFSGTTFYKAGFAKNPQTVSIAAVAGFYWQSVSAVTMAEVFLAGGTFLPGSTISCYIRA